MDKVILLGKDIDELDNLLYDTAQDFLKNFNLLDAELKSLTSRGFTGDAATALFDTYTKKVEPTLQDIAKVANKFSQYMSEQKAGYHKLMSDLDMTARG